MASSNWSAKVEAEISSDMFAQGAGGLSLRQRFIVQKALDSALEEVARAAQKASVDANRAGHLVSTMIADDFIRRVRERLEGK